MRSRVTDVTPTTRAAAQSEIGRFWLESAFAVPVRPSPARRSSSCSTDRGLAAILVCGG